MAVKLLPFQNIVDVPDVAQRHRCAIRGLAISSIVLTSMALCLCATSFMSAPQAFFNSQFMGLFALLSSALIFPLFALVCASSVVSLHNTNLWVSTDVCCNLLRSRPACCTQSCSGNKRCCARLSCAHTAAAVLASVLCILFICLVHRGCSYDQNDHYDMGYDDMGSLHYDYYPGVAKGGLCMSPRDLTRGSSTSSPSTLRRNDDICHSYPKHRCGVGNRCLWNDRSAIAEKQDVVPSPSPRPAEATFTRMPSPSPSSRPAGAAVTTTTTTTNTIRFALSRFALSRSVTEDADHGEICVKEFGSAATVTDWYRDLKQMSARDIDTIMAELGITRTYNTQNYFVTANGQKKYGQSRVYFFEKHDGPAPSNWLTHDQYAGLSLGSWYGITGNVLCRLSGTDEATFTRMPSPSPSSRPAEATFTRMPSPSPSYRPAEATSTRIPAKYVTKYATAEYTTYRFNYCVPVALFEVPVIILLVSLVATTATSAFLLRRVENGLPALALLPAGKMVV